MDKLLKNKWFLPVMVLLAVMASRLASTIYYLEDPDSLRFALGTVRFDVVKLQPHFPGYPVFIALVKPIYTLLSSFALSFSIVGGLSTFFIISSLNVYLRKQENSYYWGILLVFFCPLIWLMGNRYMPDLLGTAMVFGVFAYLPLVHKKPEAKYILLILVGLLAGTRLSYLPMVFLPTMYTLFRCDEKLKMWVVVMASGLIWLVPMVLLTGYQELITAALTHTDGHFNQWGGAVSEGEKYFMRFTETVESIWADGFGGYWWPRGILTMVVSIGLIISVILGAFKSAVKISSFEKMMLWSGLIYLVWIFFYQNVVYKPRHVLPLLPLIIIYMARGFNLLWNKKWIGKASLVVFFLAYSVVCIKVVSAHKKPSAVAETGAYLKKVIAPGDFIASTNLVNEYLQSYNLTADFVNIEEDPQKLDSLIIAGQRVYAVGIFEREFPVLESRKEVFYHNPYVNRMWPKMEVRVFND